MEKLDSSLLRDVDSSEIYQELSLETIELIHDYQTSIVDKNSSDPMSQIKNGDLFPSEAIKTHGRAKLIGLLACNTSFYDDQTEDMIDADPLAKTIMRLKLSDPDNVDQYTRALRIRRSTIAILKDQIIIDLTTLKQEEHTISSVA